MANTPVTTVLIRPWEEPYYYTLHLTVISPHRYTYGIMLGAVDVGVYPFVVLNIPTVAQIPTAGHDTTVKRP